MSSSLFIRVQNANMGVQLEKGYVLCEVRVNQNKRQFTSAVSVDYLQWEESIKFDILPLDRQVYFDLLQQSNKQVICKGSLDVLKFLKNQQKEGMQKITLKKNDKEVGQLVIYVIYKKEQKKQMIINIIDAQLIRNTEIFGKMDPYVIINYADQIKKTTVQKNKGKNPEWNQNYFFQYYNCQKIQLQVYDQDTITDDLVGKGVCMFDHLNINQQDYIVPIFYKKEKAGQVHLKIRFD